MTNHGYTIKFIKETVVTILATQHLAPTSKGLTRPLSLECNKS